MLVASLAGGAQAQQQPPAAPTSSPQVLSTPLTRDEAVRLALAQASAYQQAQFKRTNCGRRCKNRPQAAFFAKNHSATRVYIHDRPFVGNPIVGPSGEPSFIAANAIREYQAFLNVAGDIDLAGRLPSNTSAQSITVASRPFSELKSRAATLIVATDEGLLRISRDNHKNDNRLS